MVKILNKLLNKDMGAERQGEKLLRKVAQRNAKLRKGYLMTDD
jgi:hypothetical protein